MLVEHEEIIIPENDFQETPSGIHIKYMVSGVDYNIDDINENNLRDFIGELRNGGNLGYYFSQDPDLEDNYMLIETDEGNICLQYVENCGTENETFYSSFDPDYLGSDEESDMQCSDGQSIILKRYIMRDFALAADCVEYFVRTGKLYPKMKWLKCWSTSE